MREDEMVGCYHRLNEHEFEQTHGEGQESLMCCSLWGHSQTGLNNKNNNTSGIHAGVRSASPGLC